MLAKASVFIATSLDGYISRLDGSIDWLNEANTAVPTGEDCGYQKFLNSVDVVVMGRNTFEQVQSFDTWPYVGKHVVVLSSRPLTLPGRLADMVTISSETPTTLTERLTMAGARRLYVDGGITIQRFLAEGLVDDITITLIPVILGQGRPLFGRLTRDIPLFHTGTRTFEFGFVQLTYRVAGRAE